VGRRGSLETTGSGKTVNIFSGKKPVSRARANLRRRSCSSSHVPQSNYRQAESVDWEGVKEENLLAEERASSPLGENRKLGLQISGFRKVKE